MQTMASLGNQLSFFLLLVIFLSPQIQAREGKFFSFFSHFKTTHNVEDRQLPESPAPTPASAPAPAPAPTQEPASAPEFGTTIIPSGPAPEPEFIVEKGNGYGLYGVDSSEYSSTKGTPKTITDFENELLDEDFNDNKSYKKGYPQTNFHNKSPKTITDFENELLNEDFNDNKSYKKGYPQTNFHNNNEVYTKNYNNEENKNTYNNNEVYTKNYNNEENKNNYNNNEMYTKNYNNEENKNNYNNNEVQAKNYNSEEYKNNYGNDYEKKREGMSDTRFMENGKYYYNVHSENENYNNVNGYDESGRGSTENEGNYEKNQYPNEFETMEEYEKQQEAQGYTFKP